MPKLPGLQGYGLAQTNVQAAPLAPSAEGLGADAQAGARMGIAAAGQPNALQIVSDQGVPVGNALARAQAEQQKQEDAIARMYARNNYFAKADQLFADQADNIGTKEGFDSLMQGLSDLRASTVQSYAGSDAGRQDLDLQLSDAHADYMRKAVTDRIQINRAAAMQGADIATQRTSARLMYNPAGLDQALSDSDVWLNDLSTGLPPAQQSQMQMQARSTMVRSAIDGLLSTGNYQGADEVLRSKAQLMSPNDQRTAQRAIQSMQQDIENQNRDQGWEFGPEGVYRNTRTGEQRPPSEGIAQYYSFMKGAGKPETNVSVNTTENALVKDVNTQATDLSKQVDDAQSKLTLATQIDELLQNVPTGTWSAEAAAKLSRLTGIGEDKLGKIEAAQALTGDLVLSEIRKIAPVSDTDRKYVEQMQPGMAQTPEGRKVLLYIAKSRIAAQRSLLQTSRNVQRALYEEKLTPPRAAQIMDLEKQRIAEQFDKSFNPPRYVRD